MSDSFRTEIGEVIALGPKIGEGGEGSVYAVQNQETVVAKIYHAIVSHQKAAKLRLMVRGATPDLLGIAAWPMSVLLDRAGSVRGFLMPRIARARETHCLYSPKQRQQLFPEATWEFLIWAARNAAAAVDTVHAAGFVIGDINQKGFLITSDARVWLIDCDSFQVVMGEERHLCLVGVPEFTAPELIGKPFDKTMRTTNHDAFALGVLLFHLLFMGRHPFAGRYAGTDDMPVDRAVRELRFAYSQRAASFRMAPPPNSLALSAASQPIAGLFERAFGREGMYGGRPGPKEWVAGLEALRKGLKRCAEDTAHLYHEALVLCPWCQIEENGGPAFFNPQVTSDALRSLDLTTIQAFLARFQSVGPVGSPPTPTVVGSRPARLARRLSMQRDAARGLGAVAVLLFFATCTSTDMDTLPVLVFLLLFAAWLLHPGRSLRIERRRRQDHCDQVQRTWKQLVDGWQRDALAAIAKFENCKEEIGRAYRDLQALAAVRQDQLSRLHNERERLQLQAFLEQFDLETASLPGIGAGLKAMLIAYGYDSAYDVNASAGRIKGVGPKKLATLLTWRQALATRFRFDPRLGVSPTQKAAVERAILQRRKELERNLTQRMAELPDLHRRALSLRNPDLRRFEPVSRALAQAQADLKVF